MCLEIMPTSYLKCKHVLTFLKTNLIPISSIPYSPSISLCLSTRHLLIYFVSLCAYFEHFVYIEWYKACCLCWSRKVMANLLALSGMISRAIYMPWVHHHWPSISRFIHVIACVNFYSLLWPVMVLCGHIILYLFISKAFWVSPYFACFKHWSCTCVL